MSLNRSLLPAILLTLLFLQAVFNPICAGLSDVELQRLLDNSALTFTGTIIQFDSSNVSNIEASGEPMIVRVQQLEAAGGSGMDTFSALPGKEITVVVDPNRVDVNDMKRDIPTTFFANPIVYETHIAVAAETIVQSNTADLSKRIAAILKDKSKAARDAAAKNADAIVTGQVTEVSALPKEKLERLKSLDNGRELYSEHSPKWKEALIRVVSVERGDPGKDFVMVVFPGTNDRMWARAPKFSIGQVGIWMLHKTQLNADHASILLDDERLHDQPIKVFTALTLADFQIPGPGDQNLKEIRRLIKSSKP